MATYGHICQDCRHRNICKYRDIKEVLSAGLKSYWDAQMTETGMENLFSISDVRCKEWNRDVGNTRDI